MTQSSELPQDLNSKIEEAETHFLNILSQEDVLFDNDSFISSDTVAKSYDPPNDLNWLLEEAKTDANCSVIYERVKTTERRPSKIEVNKLERYIKFTWKSKGSLYNGIISKKYRYGKLIEEIRVDEFNKHLTAIEYYPGYKNMKSKKQYNQCNSSEIPTLHCDDTNEPAYIEYYENGQIKLEKYCYNGELSRHKDPALIEYSEDGQIVRTERVTCMGM